ncbi:MAG: hypothetical protein CVV42_10470 [Candidatus Riflebacteria bacterium HGW-Riflebacteria-2]|jgi:hypothetical protein|nr:MAG: hypothetical protein CVV42_10470 [Candidatus Riflebacteria bacterium HGW-Riflebacteria-2]
MNLLHLRLVAAISGMLMLGCLTVSAQTPGLYPMRIEPEGNHVYIDADGQTILRVNCLLAENFSQGYATVCESDLWHFIDRNGKKAFNKDFEEVKSFSEELAAVKENGLWGYIDLTGKMVIKPQYSRAYKFSEGLACVMIGDPADGSARFGYIDREGKYALEPFLPCLDNQYFDTPGEFSEGLAAAWLPLNADGDYLVGYINKEGKTAIAPKFTTAGKFVDDLAPVSILMNDAVAPTGFIDKSGNFVIPQSFSQASHFSEGLAPASTFDAKYEEPEMWGYIDTKGKWVIKPTYEMAEHFVGGIARVYDQLSSGGEVYIKQDGSIVANSSMLSGKAAGTTGVYKLEVKSVSASSALPPTKVSSYQPENVLDGDHATAWVEGAKSSGTGEWLEFTFAKPVEIHSIDIYNGYQKPATAKRDPFKVNQSVAKLRITRNGKSTEHAIKDERGAQTIKLDGSPTSSVKFEILAVHESKGDPDCCISEVEFTGRLAP